MLIMCSAVLTSAMYHDTWFIKGICVMIILSINTSTGNDYYHTGEVQLLVTKAKVIIIMYVP